MPYEVNLSSNWKECFKQWMKKIVLAIISVRLIFKGNYTPLFLTVFLYTCIT